MNLHASTRSKPKSPRTRRARSELLGRRRSLAADRPIPLVKASPKNERDDFAVAANPLFDAVGAEVLVVHRPTRGPQQRQLPATQTRDDRRDVAARSLGKRGVQPFS